MKKAVIVILIIFISSGLKAQSFTAITSGDVVNDAKGSRSANFLDLNNDDLPDIFFSNGKSGGENNLLYFNNGDGTFTQVLSSDIVSDGKSSDGASFADFNNDYIPDAYVGNWYGQNNLLYKGLPSGQFEFLVNNELSTDASFSESCSWADIDGDSDLDLFVANSDGDLHNYLYINNGDGTFTNDTLSPVVTEAIASRCGVWADYDNDGDPDLYVANEGFTFNSMFENNGDGTFTKITSGDFVTTNVNSWGASWGDYDNDGDFDLFVANNGGQLNHLYQNNGDKTFTTINSGAVVFDPTYTVGSSWIDYDNDGDLDLYIANGWGPATNTNRLYVNDGSGNFTSLAEAPFNTQTGWSYGCAWADYDADGDLDLINARWLNETESNSLYRNEIGSSKNWLQIKCIGTESNSSAIGTIVKIKSDINGTDRWQMRQISSQDGYCSQNSPIVSFGLDTTTVIDSLIIMWSSGKEQIQTNVTSNQKITIHEPGVRILGDIQFGSAPLDVQFSAVSGQTLINHSYDFGDGNTANSSAPMHTYLTGGIYSVTLDVDTNGSFYQTSRTDYIAVESDTLEFPTYAAASGETVDLLLNLNNYIPLKQINLPINWAGDMDLTLSAIETTGLRTENMTYDLKVYDGGNKRVYLTLTYENGETLQPGNSAILRLRFVVPGSVVNGTNIISVLNFNGNEFSMISPYGIYFADLVDGEISVGCCDGAKGDINSDGGELPDISDLLYLVDYMFNSPAGPAPVCFDESDFDSNSAIDLTDLLFLVDYMFATSNVPILPDC